MQCTIFELRVIKLRNNTLYHKSLILRVLPLLLLFEGLGTPKDSFSLSTFDFKSFDGFRSHSSAT